MATFDAPTREVCTIRRSRTNTPLQALVTLNDPVYVEAAQALAERILRHGGATSTDRIEYAFRLCLARFPTEEEIARLLSLFNVVHERFRGRQEEAKSLATRPSGKTVGEFDPVDVATWTVVGNVLLNLDELLVRG